MAGLDDRQWSAGCVLSWVLWTLTVLSVGGGWVFFPDPLAAHLQHTGLALSAAAATATIRNFHVGGVQAIQNAYKCGQDSVRSLR